MNSNKKILIIDDKAIDQAQSSSELLQQLSPEQLLLIDFKKSAIGLWEFNENQDEITFVSSELYNYTYIFIHASYDNPVLKNPKLLMEILAPSSRIVLFSGGRSEALKPIDACAKEELLYQFEQDPENIHFEIRRSVLFQNFKDFLNTFFKFDEFKIESLYDSNYNHTKLMALKIKSILFELLEESEAKAVEANEFNKLFQLAGYDELEIEMIKKNFSSKNYSEFMDAINQIINDL